MGIKLPQNSIENLPILQDSMTRFFEIPELRDSDSKKSERSDSKKSERIELSIALGHHYFGLNWTPEIKKTTLISDAKRVGWRYLIFKNNDIFADIYHKFIEGSSDLEFSHIGYGPMATRTIDALIVAETKIKTDVSIEPEFRHLEIPSIYFAAVWLHTESDDLFIPVQKGFKRIYKYEIIQGENLFEYLFENFSDVTFPVR